MTSMLMDANICAGHLQLFDDALIITALRATMLKVGNFTCNAVGPLQVLDEIILYGTNGGFDSGVPTSMGSRISRPKGR